MKVTFHNKAVTGILTILPEQEIYFENEISNYAFPEKQTMRLKKVMGFKKHRIAKPETASSDMAVFGMNHLFQKGLLKKEEIGGLIVVTAIPDHFLPHVSNIVQGECGLSKETLCIDLPQGCCGFLLGLIQGFMMLDYMGDKKVVLLNSDVLSHKVSKKDRKSYPLIGDGATITILENKTGVHDISTILETDGTQRKIAWIPAGGSRIPSTSETARLCDDGEGNFRSLDNLRMDGNGVFLFVQTEMPPVIEEILSLTGWSKEEVDWFLCHQPNQFVLRKLAEKLGVPYEKVPMNVVENFGNASGASIPMAITLNLEEQMTQKLQKCCIVAFGTGMTWGAMTAELGNMDFCEMVVSNY